MHADCFGVETLHVVVKWSLRNTWRREVATTPIRISGWSHHHAWYINNNDNTSSVIIQTAVQRRKCVVTCVRACYNNRMRSAAVWAWTRSIRNKKYAQRDPCFRPSSRMCIGLVFCAHWILCVCYFTWSVTSTWVYSWLPILYYIAPLKK